MLHIMVIMYTASLALKALTARQRCPSMASGKKAKTAHSKQGHRAILMRLLASLSSETLNKRRHPPTRVVPSRDVSIWVSEFCCLVVGSCLCVFDYSPLAKE